MNQPIMGHPARYWHALPDGRVQCDVCPRYCKLHEGQRGVCFVRARQNERIVLTTYGRSSGFCIDPIEKKPLNHFLPGSPVLSFGTAGCNLTCKFCQNWDISKARDLDRIQDVASPEAIADAAVRSGCRSVAFTYNDRRSSVPGAWTENRRSECGLYRAATAYRIFPAHGRRQHRS
jgi:pyruvate formate lyase activating enzyme